MWDLIVSVPDHCLSFYFDKQKRQARGKMERDLGDDPEVYLDDLVTLKRSKVKPLDYTSVESTSTTDNEEPESPIV